MLQFHYRALTAEHQPTTGQLFAEHADDCRARLLAQGLLPLQVRRQWRIRQTHLGTVELAELCRDLHAQLVAGISLNDALSEIASTASSRQLQQLARELQSSLAAGQPFATACTHSGQFPSVLLAILSACEQAGQLATCLGEFADYQEWSIALQRETRGRLIYPLLSALTVLGAGVFLVTYLVPTLRSLIDPSQLTLASRSLFWLVDRITQDGLMLLFSLVLTVSCVAMLLRQQPHWQQVAYRWIWRMPVLGPWRLVSTLAHYTRLLALTYGQGVPILTALQLAQQTAPQPILNGCLAQVAQRVETGCQLTQAFQHCAQPQDGIRWPPILIRLLSQAEKTGELARALQQASEQLQRQSQRTLTQLHALLQPATTLFSALFLGWVALATFGPLYAQLGQVR